MELLKRLTLAPSICSHRPDRPSGSVVHDGEGFAWHVLSVSLAKVDRTDQFEVPNGVYDPISSHRRREEVRPKVDHPDMVFDLGRMVSVHAGGDDGTTFHDDEIVTFPQSLDEDHKSWRVLE